MFVHELVWLLFALGALGAIGGGLLVPFRGQLPWLWLASPLAGIGWLCAALPLGFWLGLPLRWSLPLGSALGLLLTAAAVARTMRGRPALPLSLAVVLLLASASTLLVNETSVVLGSPGLLLVHGTDQMGYGQVGDWLASHPPSVLPVLDPSRPYESWIHHSLTSDFRPAAYLLLASCSLVRGIPSLFAFDWTMSLLVCAGILGFAGSFARSRLELVFLVCGAALSSWYDLSRGGFFAKLIMYPGVLLLTALCWAPGDGFRRLRFAALLMLAAGFSLSLEGIALALFLVSIGLAGLLFALIDARRSGARCAGAQSVVRAPCKLLGLGTLVVVPFYLVRGSGLSIGAQVGRPWSELLAVATDMLPNMDDMSDERRTCLVFALVLHVLLLAAAVYRRRPAAAALLGSAPLCLFGMWCADLRWQALQMLGTWYLFALMGAGDLIAQARESRARIWLITFLILGAGMIGLRWPRMELSLEWYSGPMVGPTQRFALDELTHIQTVTKDHSVELWLPTYSTALVALNAFGGHGTAMTMDDATWNIAVGYRSWQQPRLAPPPFVIALRGTPVLGTPVLGNEKAAADFGSFTVLRREATAVAIHWAMPQWSLDYFDPRGWCFEVGTGGAALDLENWSTEPHTICLRAEISPVRPSGSKARLVCRCEGVEGEQSSACRGSARFILQAPPGRRRVHFEAVALGPTDPNDAPLLRMEGFGMEER